MPDTSLPGHNLLTYQGFLRSRKLPADKTSICGTSRPLNGRTPQKAAIGQAMETPVEAQ
jgi:hypothetical protein